MPMGRTDFRLYVGDIATVAEDEWLVQFNRCRKTDPRWHVHSWVVIPAVTGFDHGFIHLLYQ
jgi:hypothetical protein